MSTIETATAAVIATALLLAGTDVRGEEELAKSASWSFPTQAEVRDRLNEDLAETQIDDTTRAKIDGIWAATATSGPASKLLDAVAATCGIVDPLAREVVDFCHREPTGEILPKFSILADDQPPSFVKNNLHLLYARWLAQHNYFDESLHQLEGLETSDVADPAALLFYQCAGHHRLLAKDKCLSTAAKLLEQEPQLPIRYAALARLIQSDLQPLKVDSLDEVSRLMDEVRRRLDLHRAGKRVRDQEDEIIAKLDKMIEKMEEQQQQQQSAGAGSLQPNSPAPDSMPAGGKGPGRVDSKQIGNKSGWGNLPPKQRQEALQQIGKDLPAHYREVIEEYFRKLAREGDIGQ